MNGKFFDLKKEKQDRMINAALKVFAQCGYKHASTDDIVREAAISKGLLFHYFESKLGVYTFVYEYSVRFITLELREVIAGEETDPFELLRQTQRAKTSVLRSYPYMEQFLNRASSEDVGEALVAVAEMREALTMTIEEVEKKADFSKLKPGCDGEKIMKMMDFTIKGLMTERFYNSEFQPDMMMEEISGYIDEMKKLAEK